MNPNAIEVPKAQQKIKVLSKHGDKREDPYFWLNDRDNPEVIQYLEQENAYTKAVMKPTEDLQKKLFKEMKGRIKEKDETVPFKINNYWYYVRYEEGGEYPIYCRKFKDLTGKEEILLNGNEMGKGKGYFDIGGWEISDNEKLLAFGVDTIGRRNYTLHIKNLETGEIYKDKIDNTEGGEYVWAADNKTVFYLLRDTETLLASKVLRHVLGTDEKSDVLAYEEKDDAFYLGIDRTKSEKYIACVSSQNGVSSEYRFLDASQPTGQFKVFFPRREGLEYFVEHVGDTFYILTNLDGATNFKLMETQKLPSKTEDWKTVIEHNPKIFLSDFEVFDKFIVLGERENALDHVRILNLETHENFRIEFPESVYTVDLSDNFETKTHLLRLSYSSMTTPWTVYDYDMEKKDLILKKEKEIPGGYDKTQYQTERLWATAKDGAKIPISIVYKKGFEKNGKGNILQYGYGSYGYSLSPYFSTSRLSLLDRGFAFAIVHVRGGQEMGREWYEQGRKLNKKNTFTDFIAGSEFLIKNNWTSPEHLFIAGGSAGGLLMGAVVNMRPELYKGVLAAVPFVDVLTTMLDDSIPLTTGEYEERGNPNIKKYYDYMKSYSPYDNVQAKDYPNMLVTTGLHDSQVQYFEPAKWVAKLRSLKTDNNILLLHTNMQAGHGGSSGRFESLKEVAMEYAFILNLAKISD